MKTTSSKQTMYMARVRPDLLEVMLEILAVDRKVLNPSVNRFQVICVWAKLLEGPSFSKTNASPPGSTTGTWWHFKRPLTEYDTTILGTACNLGSDDGTG